MTRPKSRVVASLTDLQNQANACVDQAEAIMAKAENEGRPLRQEEQEQFDDLMAQSEALSEQYKEALVADQQAARQALLAEARERREAMPTPRSVFEQGPLSRVTSMRDRTMVDPKRGFQHGGEFFAAVYDQDMPGSPRSDERLLKIKAAATGMQQGQGSLGGYAVPPAFSQMIWDGLNTMPGNLMQYCDVYPVTGESLTFPANAETSRATGSRYGGVQAYWIAQASQITSSAPRLRQMKLEPQEIAALVYVTDKLLRNAPALDAYVRRAAGEEIMFLVNDSILNGNGVGQPRGVMGSASLISVAKEAGQAGDSVVIENINKMYSRLHVRARAGARWFINQDVEPQLEQLTAPSGSSGLPVFLSAPGGFPQATEAPQRRLKGLPVETVEYCATVGDLGDIILANLGYYALGVQGGINEAMSMHLRFDYAETAFRFMFAVDGQTWLQSALTPFKGTNTLSSHVALAERT